MMIEQQGPSQPLSDRTRDKDSGELANEAGIAGQNGPDTTNYKAMFKVVEDAIPKATVVTLSAEADLPGARIRRLPQRKSQIEAGEEWVKVTISRDDAHHIMKERLRARTVEGLLRNDGELLIRIYNDHGFAGIPVAVSANEADQEAKKLVMSAIEHLYNAKRTGAELESDIIVLATDPTPEERARQQKIADEITEAVREERRYGGSGGPKIKLTHIRGGQNGDGSSPDR
jgi:hypothetical protein